MPVLINSRISTAFLMSRVGMVQSQFQSWQETMVHPENEIEEAISLEEAKAA